MVRRGESWQSRQVKSCLRGFWHGRANHGGRGGSKHGKARLGAAWRIMAVGASLGKAVRGVGGVRLGMAGMDN